MYDPYTLRILELDGGGERGYLSLQFLQLFLNKWLKSSTANVASYFDVICGTSIGGVMALALAAGADPFTFDPFFLTQGPLIFSTNGNPSNAATTADKLISIGFTGVPFYATNPGTNYGSALLVSQLESMFGTNTMQSLQTNVIIPTYKVNLRSDNTISNGVYTLCSNANFPDFTGQNELLSNVALATSAAPFYFPSIELTDRGTGTLNGRYIDGGVYQNNPSSFGRNLATILKPSATRCCVLSLGTGLGEMGFDDPPPVNLLGTSVAPDPLINVTNLFSLFDVSGTGGQESISKNLYLESTYSLNQLYYYRFQPVLDITLDTELDNTTTAITDYYKTTATEWFNTDEENICTFIGHLMA